MMPGARTTNKLYIVPLGDIPQAVIEAVRNALGDVYGFEVALHGGAPLPVASFNIDRRQFLSYMVIEELARMALGGAALGIADEDLYAQGLNFVFGEADREKGVAVISIARLRKEFYGGSPDEGLLLERSVKEAVHEVGHLVGLPHCPKTDCVMHFSSTISHTDKKSARPCAVCERMYKNIIHP